MWSTAVPTVRPPLTKFTVTSPVLPEEVNTALALLPDRSVAVTVPMDASLTVKTASSGRVLAAAPE